jgi:hypothetical protein
MRRALALLVLLSGCTDGTHFSPVVNPACLFFCFTFERDHDVETVLPDQAESRNAFSPNQASAQGSQNAACSSRPVHCASHR